MQWPWSCRMDQKWRFCFWPWRAGRSPAPLNAAYREDEFDFYLNDLDAKAVIVMCGQDTPVRAVAAKRGITIIELSPDTGGPAGGFTLSVPYKNVENPHPTPDDVALLLHTSGTTSRPKIVPLSHRNLTASARNIAGTLALSPEDRCLVIMPLFHIHGLVGALLSSLWAGASVFCPSGFNALKFYSWLDESDATWYTAVPTMHQAILSRADRNAEVIRKQRLRLIRSSSVITSATGHGRIGEDLWLSRNRVIRHDRSCSPDGQQSTSTIGAQTGKRGACCGSRSCDHGTG